MLHTRLDNNSQIVSGAYYVIIHGLNWSELRSRFQ